MTNNFIDRAKSLGHDNDALKKGKLIRSTISVDSIDELKKIITHGMNDKQKRAFTSPVSMQKPGDKTKSTPALPSLITKLMNHVYGDAPLETADKKKSLAMFPLQIQGVSGGDVTINTDLVIGPGGAPYVINADNLIFDGGSLTVISTSLTIVANNLILKSPGTKPYHIGILGQNGATGPNGTDGSPYNNAAQNGSNASAPTPGICTGASDGGNGDAGQKGNPGTAPTLPGNDGKPSMPANISIGAYDQSNSASFVVFTQSGAGGNGGNGGNGGPGQDGGNGGSGCDSGCEGTDGGNGGNAGDGGDGGAAGNGGNGVNGLPISISFPNSSKTKLQPISTSAAAGGPGNPGNGGGPGNPGNGGSGGKHKSDGQAGSGGKKGSGGASGSGGRNTGAPGPITINYT